MIRHPPSCAHLTIEIEDQCLRTHDEERSEVDESIECRLALLIQQTGLLVKGIRWLVERLSIKHNISIITRYISGYSSPNIWTFQKPRTMNEVSNYLEDLNKSINHLEQKSTLNNRLSEEKMLTRHLVREIRTLVQMVKHQQENSNRAS